MQHRSQHRSPKSSRRGHFYKVSGPSPLGSQGRLRDAGRTDAFPPEHPAGAQQLEYPPRVKYKSVFLKPEVWEPLLYPCGCTAARAPPRVSFCFGVQFVQASGFRKTYLHFEFTQFERFRICVRCAAKSQLGICLHYYLLVLILSPIATPILLQFLSGYYLLVLILSSIASLILFHFSNSSQIIIFWS